MLSELSSLQPSPDKPENGLSRWRRRFHRGMRLLLGIWHSFRRRWSWLGRQPSIAAEQTKDVSARSARPFVVRQDGYDRRRPLRRCTRPIAAGKTGTLALRCRGCRSGWRLDVSGREPRVPWEQNWAIDVPRVATRFSAADAQSRHPSGVAGNRESPGLYLTLCGRLTAICRTISAQLFVMHASPVVWHSRPYRPEQLFCCALSARFC